MCLRFPLLLCWFGHSGRDIPCGPRRSLDLSIYFVSIARCALSDIFWAQHSRPVGWAISCFAIVVFFGVPSPSESADPNSARVIVVVLVVFVASSLAKGLRSSLCERQPRALWTSPQQKSTVCVERASKKPLTTELCLQITCCFLSCAHCGCSSITTLSPTRLTILC